MAQRSIYIPDLEKVGVTVKKIDFQWYPGMAKVQKQRSISSLHEEGEKHGISPILEISSKSKDDLGIKLSAFNLFFTTQKYKQTLSVEAAFQGSKVFEHGGPFQDLYSKSSREAKKDIRLKESGNLICFQFFGITFDLKPRTLFYDWLYINALLKNKNLGNFLTKYKGFTDIEFNPKKSINCQAYSAALYVSLIENNISTKSLKSPDEFLMATKEEYKKYHNSRHVQSTLV
ncbi:MAG: DarT1-associated NADAR antitoxin family protein [Alcanivorax sp.]